MISGSSSTPNNGRNPMPPKSTQAPSGSILGRLKSVIVGSNPNGNQAPPTAPTWVIREGASLDEKSPMLFWVPGVRASDREFMTSVIQALGGHVAIFPDESQGPSIAPIYDILLSGVAPSRDAHAIVKGHSRHGGFTLRVIQGGNAVHIIVFITDADGNRRYLGSDNGTVFQCQGSRVWHRYPAAYDAAIKVITEAANHGGIYVCASSAGWPQK